MGRQQLFVLLLSPLRGSQSFSIVNPWLTPGAKCCRRFAASWLSVQSPGPMADASRSFITLRPEPD